MLRSAVADAPDDHDKRLARIADRLATLRKLTADTHEEVLVATEQLIERAIQNSRTTAAEVRKAVADSRSDRLNRQKTPRKRR
jgi:hypothetical protein